MYQLDAPQCRLDFRVCGASHPTPHPAIRPATAPRLPNSRICLLPPIRSADDGFRGCSGRANHRDRVMHAHLPDADSGA